MCFHALNQLAPDSQTSELSNDVLYDPVPQGAAKLQAIELGAPTKICSSKCLRPAVVQSVVSLLGDQTPILPSSAQSVVLKYSCYCGVRIELAVGSLPYSQAIPPAWKSEANLEMSPIWNSDYRPDYSPL